MTNLYCIAEKKIAVNSLHFDIHTLCSDYQAEGEADFAVAIIQSDIDFERERSAAEDCVQGKPICYFEDGHLETLAVYRKIAEKMPDYDTVLMHGSAIAVDDEGYLFTAKSGTGKSTHTRLWREMLGNRAVMVNDDKPLIRVTDAGAVIYGTPWDGKHRLSSNLSVPLKAICILERAENNTIHSIGKREAYSFLVGQTYRPKNPEALLKTLDLLDKICDITRLYRLGCNMKPEAAKIAYHVMKG